ncbi:MAG: TolC family protein [Saprospiraceae bacterium]
MLNTVQKILLVYCLFLLLPGALTAQTPALDQLIQELDRQNPDLSAARLLENERLLEVELAAANRRPQVSLLSDYLFARGGRTIDFPVGDLFNPVYGTLNQLSGAERFPTDLENVNEQLMPNNFHDTRVEARLPLIQPLIRREAAVRRAGVSRARAATAVRRNDLVLQVRQLYYAYRQSVAGRAVIDSSIVVLQELARVNRSRVSNDLATREVVYRTEAELAKLAGQAAELDRQHLTARAALNRLLGRELDRPLPDENPIAVADTRLDLPDLATLSGTARSRRPELDQLSAGLQQLTDLADLQRAELQPTLGLRAQAGAQGRLNGDFSGQPYVTLGLGFAWTVYDGKKTDLRTQITRLQAEQLQQRRADTERAVELQTRQAYYRIQAAQARLRAAAAGIRATEETYRLTERRYRSQQAILLEVLDARNEWTTARLDYQLAYFELKSAEAKLAAALGEESESE